MGSVLRSPPHLISRALRLRALRSKTEALLHRNPPVLVPPGHRFCFTCWTLKAHAEFHRDRNARDGHCANCKACGREMRRRGRAVKRVIEETYQRLSRGPERVLRVPEVDVTEPYGAG